MRIVVDVPFKYAHWVVEVGLAGHLVSAELLQSSKTYFKFYKRLGKKGHHLIVKDLKELTPDISKVLGEARVSEVISPPDPEFEFMKQAARLKIGVIGIPQGRNQEEFFRLLESMYMSRFVTVIGLSKSAMSSLWDAPDVRVQSEMKLLLYMSRFVTVIGLSKSAMSSLWDAPDVRVQSEMKLLLSRLSVLKYMLTQDLVSKPVHILGLANPRVELPLYQEIGKHSPLNIRSVSTSHPFDSEDLSPAQLRRALSTLLYLTETYI